jgi:hypothetical protein
MKKRLERGMNEEGEEEEVEAEEGEEDMIKRSGHDTWDNDLMPTRRPKYREGESKYDEGSMPKEDSVSALGKAPKEEDTFEDEMEDREDGTVVEVGKVFERVDEMDKRVAFTVIIDRVDVDLKPFEDEEKVKKFILFYDNTLLTPFLFFMYFYYYIFFLVFFSMFNLSMQMMNRKSWSILPKIH